MRYDIDSPLRKEIHDSVLLPDSNFKTAERNRSKGEKSQEETTVGLCRCWPAEPGNRSPEARRIWHTCEYILKKYGHTCGVRGY